MHYYRGLSKFLKEDFQNAKDPFLKALECIEGDKQVDQNRWQPTKNMIRQYIAHIDKQDAISNNI